jgi:protein-S-isoprenylcysteine O-methyltransferase Ste14
MLKDQTLQTEVAAGARLWLRKQIVMLLIVFAVLFLSAGRLDWVWGWVQWVLLVLSVLGQIVFVMLPNPALMAERSKVQRGTKSWDIVLAGLAAAVLPMVTWLLAGLDVRFGWTGSFDLALRLLGVAMYVAGYAFIVWAMAANPFFAATVRIQDDRAQRVIADGPYRIVRHPGYLGAIVSQLGTPLLLGSWIAFVPSLIAAILFVVRTGLEDRTLQTELAGYSDYARRTPYRLAPGVW